jgi:flagellar basal-body rod protein FlgF
VNNGIYTAFSGMQAQLDALDILANNLANANTVGFKEEKAFFTILTKSLDDPRGSESLNAAINQSIQTRAALNVEGGSITPTNWDLDIAIEGNGFLVVDTPRGIRYTRNGSLNRNAQSALATADGFPVLGADGGTITLGPKKVNIKINENGAVMVDGAEAGRLKVVAFEDLSALQKEGSSLFASRTNPSAERSSNAKIRSGYLEQSNVNAVSSIVQMVDLLRHFESIQKGVNLMNDIDSKAIDKLGR